ncbi:hypothetical protein ABBQ38_005836 [Trebouxia sp. C0009 RCD-2024]
MEPGKKGKTKLSSPFIEVVYAISKHKTQQGQTTRRHVELVRNSQGLPFSKDLGPTLHGALKSFGGACHMLTGYYIEEGKLSSEFVWECTETEIATCLLSCNEAVAANSAVTHDFLQMLETDLVETPLSKQGYVFYHSTTEDAAARLDIRIGMAGMWELRLRPRQQRDYGLQYAAVSTPLTRNGNKFDDSLVYTHYKWYANQVGREIGVLANTSMALALSAHTLRLVQVSVLGVSAC